ncbi:GNAT family N-acetyltransferase [uncultured Enterococcus sp.]|uniref:GNAT family N-acetyltransferase n=1 Tax=uncultured Enterococcus sp. TaxID=167972 RepID=UPI002AA84736|nr:GNAT family N-acetyltransferase [uncultured Enterococcus sp.]
MTAEDTQQMFELAAYAFNSETTEDRKKRFDWVTEHSECYGSFDGNQLTSQLLATPFITNFHGVEYKMAGIGCVSSYPEYRGQGGITALMKKMLADLAEEKTALSYLAPFSYPFYRRYGYEQIFEQIEYTIEPRNWPNIRAVAGSVRRVDWSQAKATIQSIYSQVAEVQRGGLKREEWWQEYKFALGKEHRFAIYENEEGQAEGYLVYQTNVERFMIVEWQSLSKNGYSALARFVGSHNGATHQFYFKKGFAGEDLSWLIPSPLLDMQLKPYMMGRIVDFQTFLSAYPFHLRDGEKVFYLEVADEFGPWNEGIWELKMSDGKVTLSKTETPEEEAVLKASIQTWTQLFMGYRSGETLHFHQQIFGKEEQLQELAELLPTGKPILEDYF